VLVAEEIRDEQLEAAAARGRIPFAFELRELLRQDLSRPPMHRTSISAAVRPPCFRRVVSLPVSHVRVVDLGTYIGSVFKARTLLQAADIRTFDGRDLHLTRQGVRDRLGDAPIPARRVGKESHREVHSRPACRP
jgi:hypothetical protein